MEFRRIRRISPRRRPRRIINPRWTVFDLRGEADVDWPRRLNLNNRIIMKFFLKEIASNPFIIDGKPVQFEVFPSNRGLLQLDEEKDAALIKELDLAASQRRGGVVRIDQAQYEELKKNEPLSKPSAAFIKPSLLRVLQVPKPLARPSQPAPAASPVAANSSVPSAPALPVPPRHTPRRGRIKSPAAAPA